MPVENRENPPLLAYVDESGDTSLHPRSSAWFFLSACIVRRENVEHVASYIEEAKDIIWRKRGQNPREELDWKRLSHPQRGALLPIFASRPYTQIVIGMWARHFNRAGKINEANWAYRYVCRYMLERISWFARDNGGFVRITFSKTDRLDIAQLRSYVRAEMQMPNCTIAPSFDIDDIRESSISRTPMLTLADNATSSFAAGFNPDTLGVTYPHHTRPAFQHLYRLGRRGVWTYGFKILPHDVPIATVRAPYPFTDSW